jgi:thiamine-phosphate pyrophosphorylase
MRLIVLTCEREFVGEINVINKLFVNGLDRLHIRKYQYTAHDYRGYIRQVDPIYHHRIVIHGGFELVHEFGLAGIHLSSYIRNDGSAQEHVKAVSAEHISTSFHSWREIEENTYPYGYVFISPVFDSISKPGYNAAIDKERVAEVKAHCRAAHGYCPAIYGLGGVDAGNVAMLAKNGFDGGVILGGVWGKDDPVNAFVAIKNAII